MVNDNKLGEQQPNNSQLSRPRVRDDPRWGCDGDQHPGSGFELQARIFQGAKKRLIATHPKLEIALTPLQNLNLVFSNRNKKRVSTVALLRELPITGSPRDRASRAKRHSFQKFYLQQGKNRIRYNLLKTKDRGHF